MHRGHRFGQSCGCDAARCMLAFSRAIDGYAREQNQIQLPPLMTQIKLTLMLLIVIVFHYCKNRACNEGLFNYKFGLVLAQT